MTEQIITPSDVQRIERGVERMNDKVDLVWSGMSDLKSTLVRLETESLNNAKQTERNRNEFDNYKMDNISKLDKLEDKIGVLEKNQSDLRIKVAPVFLILAILLSTVTAKVASVIFPTTVVKAEIIETIKTIAKPEVK
jgi:predicted  nucleic acid-binding Zn-ribbon protein